MPCWGRVQKTFNAQEFYSYRAESKKVLTAKGLVPDSRKFNEILSRKMNKKFGRS